MRWKWDAGEPPPRPRYTRLSVLTLRVLLRRTERKQARAIAALRRCHGDECTWDAAFYRWWLDLLDERHAELRIALCIRTGQGSAVLRFAGGERSPFPPTRPVQPKKPRRTARRVVAATPAGRVRRRAGGGA